jgi:hypothetical protein
VRTNPFGSVGDRDVAAAAYMDVFTAVPKGFVRADEACDGALHALPPTLAPTPPAMR